MGLRADQLTKPLKVTKRIQETPEAVSLVLEIPQEFKQQFSYQAGQFVTFFMNINGETINRSYSLSTSPIVEEEFKVTIKKVPGGKGSTYLCDKVKEGDVLMTTPPAGNFFKPPHDGKGTHYMLFAAGSGITPVFSVMKTVMASSKLNHVTLAYCNRNQESIIYAKELERWAREYPARLDVINVLSKPSYGWPGRSGRLERSLIHEIVDMRTEAPPHREYYLCGPTEFMTLVRNTLVEHGISKDVIREENFGLSVHKPHAVNEGWTLIGPELNATYEGPETIIAELHGQTLEVKAKAGQTILETLLESGAQPPYSCMDGACMACMGKVTAGRVYQEDPGILTDDNIRNHEALTCQAKPLSRIVRISYDNL